MPHGKVSALPALSVEVTVTITPQEGVLLNVVLYYYFSTYKDHLVI